MENKFDDIYDANLSVEAGGTIEVSPVVQAESGNKEKLWTPNFFLLWQGQLVSVLGDVVYNLALGFWILAATGSTALMGTLMAASTLPAVLVSPFAGVIVDRADRKWLMIATDIIRGLAVVFLAAAAYMGFIEIWMVFVTGIILGLGGAFFSPTVNSAIPDLVPPSKIMAANSVIGMVGTGSNIVGSSAGGLLLQILGAPFMFLFNGLSFIVSAVINLFIKIPKIQHKTEQHFFADMKAGYLFVWKMRGLRYMIMVAALSNFLSFIGIVLFLPLFQMNESLGPAKYGITMAFFTGGMFLAMGLISAIKIPPHIKPYIFLPSEFLTLACFAAFGLVEYFPLMVLLQFAGGFFMAIVNVFVYTTIQLAVPQDMRGKVFSLVGTVCSSLMPFAMALGGVLGEFFPLRSIIFACFAVQLVLFLPLVLVKSFTRFVAYDPEKQTLEDLM